MVSTAGGASAVESAVIVCYKHMVKPAFSSTIRNMNPRGMVSTAGGASDVEMRGVDPEHEWLRATVGSYEMGVSYERGTPVNSKHQPQGQREAGPPKHTPWGWCVQGHGVDRRGGERRGVR